MWKKIKPYVISIALTLGVGGLSALLTAGNMDLYSEIVRPPLAPPPWLFPVMWTILYILMGISSAMIFTSDASKRDINNSLTVYGINLFLNFFWSIIFFNMRAYLFAFIWLIALWVTILLMIIKFVKIRPIAGYLQIPYLLWVTFAGYLTLAIYILN